MIQAAVGVSHGGDPYTAGADACQDAKNKLGSYEPHAVIVFSSVQYDQEKMVAGVRSVSGNALLVGSSTAGEITTAGPARRNSVSVMLLHSDTVNFYGAVGEHVEQSPAAAGKRAAEDIQTQIGDEELSACLMFPDALSGDGAEIVHGLLGVLGQHTPIIGGSSADDFRFEKTFQYFNDSVFSGSVVTLGLTGDFAFGVGVKHGWLPVGAPRKVTRAEGAVVHEIDGKPAISMYEDYFGRQRMADFRRQVLAQLTMNYPLGMQVAGGDEMLIRVPLSVHEDGAFTCTAKIPEGAEVRLMVGSKDVAVEKAREAAQDAVNMLEGAEPQAAFVFNSVARKRMLGELAKEEIMALQGAVGSNVPLIGFCTYGEQAPLDGRLYPPERIHSVFQNETVVVFLLAERVHW